MVTNRAGVLGSHCLLQRSCMRLHARVYPLCVHVRSERTEQLLRSWLCSCIVLDCLNGDKTVLSYSEKNKKITIPASTPKSDLEYYFFYQLQVQVE